MVHFAYIGLYLLAPVLNAFVEKATEKELRWVLICFYIFQTLYGWIFGGTTNFFLNGYSTMSFIGLYLLARYVRLYPNKLTQMSRWADLAVFFSLVIFQTMLFRLPLHLFSYINPIVIIEALYLLLFFSKIHFQNRTINIWGGSSFAAYLLHNNPNLCKQYYVPSIQRIYGLYDGLLCIIAIFIFLLIVFATAVFIDQWRIFCWNKFMTVYERKNIDKENRNHT